MLHVILTFVQVFSSAAIIGLVLLQRGKGAEAGAGFGAGASGTVFGARGASTALSRATAIFAAIFMLNSLLLTYMGTHSAAAAQTKSILDVAGEKNSGASATQGTNKPALTPAPSSGTAPMSGPAGTTGSGPTAPTPAPTAAVPVPATPAPAAPVSAPTQQAPTQQAPAAPTNGTAPK